jgi:hypothetical protein
VLTIKCIKNGNPFETTLFQYVGRDETPEETKSLANTIWKNLLNDSTVERLHGLMPDGSVMIPQSEKNMTWGVWGYFNVPANGKPKLYPFECGTQLKEGEQFVAMPNGVPAIATVAACRWVEREKVVKACNGHALFKIKKAIRNV